MEKFDNVLLTIEPKCFSSYKTPSDMDILDCGGWWWIYFGCQWVLCDSGGYIFTGGGGLYRMAVDGAIA